MTPQMRFWMACAKESFRSENKDLETMVNEHRKAILEMGSLIIELEELALSNLSLIKDASELPK